MARLTWQRDLPNLPSDLLAQVRATGIFQEKSVPMVAAAMCVMQNFEGERLTVRQLYYQMVARGYIENTPRAYDGLGKMLVKARESGVIDWRDFEDRARRVDGEFEDWTPATEDPADVARRQIREALRPKLFSWGKWLDQDAYLEVWVEKDALAGFFEPVCKQWGVPLVVSRGYTSYTYRQEARRRLEDQRGEGRLPVLLYFGDLDPSGWDIWRMLRDELSPVAELERPALNADQVRALRLPPMPQKDTDGRQAGFQELFPALGNDCYELDAMEPSQLRSLLGTAIGRHYDQQRVAIARASVRFWQDEYEAALRTFADELRAGRRGE